MHLHKTLIRRAAMTTMALAVALLSIPPMVGFAQSAIKAPLLPGGASSLRETYEDWQVICATEQETSRCVLSQQQRQKKNNQLVLSAEFGPEQNDGAVAGTLVLPFGLLLQSGVTLQIDDKPATPAFAFRTCLPVGCIVPLVLDKSQVASARAGTTFKITATSSDGNQPIHLSVSLKGFATSLARIKALTSG